MKRHLDYFLLTIVSLAWKSECKKFQKLSANIYFFRYQHRSPRVGWAASMPTTSPSSGPRTTSARSPRSSSVTSSTRTTGRWPNRSQSYKTHNAIKLRKNVFSVSLNINVIGLGHGLNTQSYSIANTQASPWWLLIDILFYLQKVNLL